MAKPDALELPKMPAAGQGKEFGSTKKLMKALMMFQLQVDEAQAATAAFATMVALESNGAQLKASVSSDIDSNHFVAAAASAGGGVQALGASRDTAGWQAQMTQQVEPLKSDASSRDKEQKEFFQSVLNYLSRLHKEFEKLAEKLGGNVREQTKDLQPYKKEYAEMIAKYEKLKINISALGSKLDAVNRQLDALLPSRKAAQEKARVEEHAKPLRVK